MKQGIINGCGGQGGLNFSKLMRGTISALPEFKKEKYSKLLDDIELDICGPHDLTFYIGGGIFDYFLANFKFAYEMFKILHWTKFYKRLLISIVCFLGLMLGGKGYFNWCLPNNKKTI